MTYLSRLNNVITVLYSVLILSGCASFPDVPVCVFEGSQGYCDTTLDANQSESFHLDDTSQFYTDSSGNKFTWDQLVRASYIVPPNTWSAIESFVQAYCHQNNGVGCNGVGQWFGGATSQALKSRIQTSQEAVLRNR
jgi:hypothetical protein